MEKRNQYSAEFKAKVVIEVLRETETVNQIAARYQLSPQQISKWKRDFTNHAASVFEKKKTKEDQLRKELDEKEQRYQKIVSQLSYELDWLKKNWSRLLMEKHEKPCMNQMSGSSALLVKQSF